MKKQFLLFFCLGCLFSAFAQENLRNTISGSEGVSKHFIQLDANKQILFNPLEAAAIFGFNGNENLVLIRAEADPLGNMNYRYAQTFKNIPVENAMYIVRTKAGKLVGASGEIITQFDALEALPFRATIQAKKAVDIAIQFVHAQSYMWQDARAEEILKEQMKNKNATYSPSATLVWYNIGDQIIPSKLQLAYKVDVYATEPMSRAYYFIDAQTGKIIGQAEILHTVDAVGTANTLYSGTQTIHSDHYNGSYRLRDYSRGNGVTTYDWSNNKSDITSSSANFNLTGLPRNGLDAHWGVEMTYDFYKINFNRNSLDDNGKLLNSYVNRGGFLYTNNASWDGTNMNYGKRSGSNDGVTAIDVTGHELTHGFTQYTSGLNYSGESGGMNESMSDIMGKSVQFWAKPADKNWVLSNDMNWAIRDMSNPNAFKQPDTYGGLYWKANADVHILSGVGNFMFYLLVDGGSGTNDIGNAYTVQGLGLTKADQIIYRTNTTYLAPNSKYADWRIACINAATDLYGANSNEVIQVKNAWYAVGIGTAGGGGNNYCASSGSSTAHGYIQRVRIQGTSLNNGSGDNNGYGDYTSTITNITKNQNYILYLRSGFSGTKYATGWSLYVDLNNDKDFNDAGELIATKSYDANTQIDTIQFKLPSSATNGNTRMRIQMNAGNPVTDPCTILNYGEVEDYSLNISGSNFINDTAQETDKSGKIIISPNPVTGSFARVQFDLKENGNVVFKLYDIAGQLVRVQNVGNMLKGSHNITLHDLNKLPGRNFLLVIEQNNMPVYKAGLLLVK